MSLPRLSPLMLVPYLGLIVALSLGAWSYFRADQYRLKSEEILSETYEIQWRVAQVRERLIRVSGYLQVADKAGILDPDIHRQIQLIDVNVKQLLALPYVETFMPTRERQMLKELNSRINAEVAPTLTARKNFPNALATMQALEKQMIEISSSTVNHSSTLQQQTLIDIAATRNWYYFGIALALVAICALALHQRYVLKDRHNKQMRSLAVLYQHMTHTRVSALRLFTESLGSRKPSPTLVEAAHRTATELETINDTLLAITAARRDNQTKPLGDILLQLRQNDADGLIIDVSPAARDLPIPSRLFILLLSELVSNARTAVNGVANGSITIRGDVKPARLWRGSELNLEVTDNGRGMSPEILSKARTPYFSTKSGRHMGLGLTSCTEIVETLRGKLRLHSAIQKGTTVHMRLPVETARF
ncbi:MAG: ATP-binding protein [Rhizobiaceae bacterium]|nr:ATP-binding protein [Rhizobiaceae bacterium]